jgi:hypothetical protein
MTEISVKQFGTELTSFFVLVLLNLMLGALAMAIVIQIIITTLLQHFPVDIPSLLLSLLVVLFGLTGIGICIFWVMTSARILRGIKKVRNEYRYHAIPVQSEILTGWIVAVVAHYRENRPVIRRMTSISTLGGATFLALGVANFIEGIQAFAVAGGGNGYLAFLAAIINLTLGVGTLHFARGFRIYSDAWDLRIDRVMRDEESLQRTLEIG